MPIENMLRKADTDRRARAAARRAYLKKVIQLAKEKTRRLRRFLREEG